MAHAVLSPSAASRWLACTPSARLEQKFPDSAGEAAKEGTVAHSLAELLVRLGLGMITQAKYLFEFKQIEKSQYYNSSMMEYCDDYATFVIEKFNLAKSTTPDAKIFLEQRLDLTEYIPEGFGTGDCVIIADQVMYVIDLKFGKGVLVSAVENTQMKLYSLGALKDFDLLYDIERVEMTIHQPRINNISTFEIEKGALIAWAVKELMPRATMAFNGEGDFTPGPHCGFCKAKAVCRANADHQLELAAHDFKPSELLEDLEVSDILERAASFKNWIAAVESYALNAAVNEGKKWPGFKLVTGRSNRKYSDEEKVSEVLTPLFKPELLFAPQKLLGITALEKNIGKDEFAQHVAPLLIKPPGAPTLVPLADKRPEQNTAEAAAADFAQ